MAKIEAEKQEFVPVRRARLEIEYQRAKGGADAANIVGGIAETLEGIAYKNDRDIRAITYSERRASTQDVYFVHVVRLAD